MFRVALLAGYGLVHALLATGHLWVEATAPAGTSRLDDTGKVEEVLPGGVINFKTSKNEPWLIQVVRGEANIRVEGTAEHEYLRNGLNVRFSGEIDKKGVLVEEIKELEIFTPHGKNDLGLFASDEEDAKPVRNAAAGSYTIKGKLSSFKDKDIIVKAGGKSISGKLADDLSLKVNLDDVGLAKPGDSAKLSAWYYDQEKPSGATPGKAMAMELKVTLSKPLAPLKKGKPVRSVKSPGKGEPKPEMPVADPFGVDDPKKK